MPSTAKETLRSVNIRGNPPITSPMPVQGTDWKVGAYTLNTETYASVSLRARDQGKPVSAAKLVEVSAPFDDGDHYLVESELLRGLDTIAPSRLPPQSGLATTASVRSALYRAYDVLKPDFPHNSADALPPSYSRVIVESFGGVASANEVFVSAYLAHDPNQKKISRLRAKSTIYFERKKFGEPAEVFGPFHIDKLGIPIETDPPAAPDDGVDEAALIASLPSQAELARALNKGEHLSAEFYAYDYTTAADLEVYDQLAKRIAARLSGAQRRELDKLTGYGTLGNLNPQLNRDLATGSSSATAGAKLLDGALERGTELPPGTLLFRGIAADTLQGKKGKTLVDPRYLCTSLDPGMARDFADKAKDNGGKAMLLAIEIGDGVKGLVTGNRGETEVLLPRDLKLSVLGSKREKGYVIYHVKAG